MAFRKPKPTKTQQILEVPLTLPGGVVVGCESVVRYFKERKQSRKMIRDWEEALNGPDRYQICAMGPVGWARISAQREKGEQELIEAFSVKLFKVATEGADAIRKLSEDRAVQQPRYGLDREWFPVFTAFHGFYLHLTDREAFAAAGNASRYQILNRLVHWSIDLAVNTVLQSLPSDKLPAIKRQCVEHLNWSNDAYGQYKRISAAPGEAAGGTVVWRLGAEVAELAGRPGNSAYILTSQDCALRGHAALEAKSYVARFGPKSSQT